MEESGKEERERKREREKERERKRERERERKGGREGGRKESLLNTLNTLLQFTRPSNDRFIRIFEQEGDEVVSINVATSSDVVYPSDTLGRTLIFSTNYSFPENQEFYIVFDQGNGIATIQDFSLIKIKHLYRYCNWD